MADTGQRSPTASTGFSFGATGAYDGNLTSGASTFGIGSAKTHTLSGFAGDDLPAGTTVNGVKVLITARHYIFFTYEAATFTSVKLSLNDGSAYSSDILSSNQNTTATATEYTFGGATETWGLSWSGFTDISDLKVEFISAPADGAGNHFFITHEVYAQVYYTEAGGGGGGTPTLGSVKLNGAKIQIVSGKFLIE